MKLIIDFPTDPDLRMETVEASPSRIAECLQFIYDNRFPFPVDMTITEPAILQACSRQPANLRP